MKEEYKKKYKQNERVELPNGLSRTDCPNCHNPVKQSEIDQRGHITCSNCGTKFQLDKDVEIFERTKPFVQLPRKMDYLKLHSMLEFIYKPDGFAVKFLLFFTIVWNLFMFIFVSTVIASGDFSQLLFMSVHLIVGAGLGIKTIGDLVNKTYITIDPEYIFIERKPLQILKSKPIETKDIKQFYVKKYSSGTVNDKPVYSYGLYAKLHNGREKLLLKGFVRPEHAQFIEQEIEEFLGIQDKRMSGEV